MISFYHCRRPFERCYECIHISILLQNDLVLYTTLLAFSKSNGIKIKVGLMELPFVLAETYDTREHHFRVYSLDKDASTIWMNELADEYVKLRTRRKHVLEG